MVITLQIQQNFCYVLKQMFEQIKCCGKNNFFFLIPLPQQGRKQTTEQPPICLPMSVCRVTCPYLGIYLLHLEEMLRQVYSTLKNERDFCLCVVYGKAIMLLILRGQVQMQINYCKALRLSKSVLEGMRVLRKSITSADGSFP